MSGEKRIPSAEELARLREWARAAFAVRCTQHVESLSRASEAVAAQAFAIAEPIVDNCLVLVGVADGQPERCHTVARADGWRPEETAESGYAAAEAAEQAGDRNGCRDTVVAAIRRDYELLLDLSIGRLNV